MEGVAVARAGMPTAATEPVAKACKTEAGVSRAKFLEVYQGLKQDVLTDPMLSQTDAKSWMARMLDYNVPGGKLNRGMSVKDTLLTIKPDASPADHLLADQIGWAIEFLQAYFLVADDIMDKSVTRRGQPCWYRVPEVGMIAINDGILLEQIIYFILRKHLKGHAAYGAIMDLFLETTHQTAHGQLLDLITAPMGSVDLRKYTLTRYIDIVTYKTAFYSFYLPVACGMHLADVATEDSLEVAKKILIKMGQYFQIQDDYLDCFADASVLGKVGTDIQDNKCSWLICQALKCATLAQKTIIAENYGKDDDACVQRIKNVYKELDLASKFAEFEDASYKELKDMMAAQTEVPIEVFELFLAKIYKRSK